MTNQTTVIRVRMTSTELSKAKAKAATSELSLSAFVRGAISDLPMIEYHAEDAAAELIDLYGQLLKENQTEFARRVLAVAYRLKGDSQ
jgi:hypothetical protein